MKKAILIATVQSHICQFHRPLIEILKKNGYEVHVAARDNLDEKNGLKLENVDRIFDIEFHRSPFNFSNIRAYKQLRSILKREQYEIISCNTPVGGIVSRLAARDMSAKVYYMAHGFHFYKGAPKKNWILYYPIEKLFSSLTDCLITITKEDYNFAKQSKFKTKICYLPGVGVDQNRFMNVNKEEIENLENQYGCYNKTVLLCTGELNKNKNQKNLIEAMQNVVKYHDNVILFLAGNGPLEKELKMMVENLNLDKYVVFLGYRTDIEKFVQLSDIVISVSNREGLPLNIIEAMICSKAIIVSNNRGHRELITNNVNGILLDKNESNILSNKIIELLDNKKLRELYGKNAFDDSKKYWVDNIKNMLKEIYLGGKSEQ